MKILISLLAVLVMLLAPPVSHAKPQIITWTWPVDNCDGSVLAQADLVEAELIYSIIPMPMPSDNDGPCASGSGDPDAPAGSLTVPIPVTDNSVILNVQPGETYYVRMKVSAYVNDNWSSWSVQYDFIVPYGRPNRIIIGHGLDRLEYYLIEDPVIHLRQTS